MQIESVALNKIIPYIRNPRKNENAVEKVASSIQEFGFRQPIVVDAENVIIAGHTRFEAAKRLGLDVVPIHVADGLTEQQAKAYRIADNRVGQEAEWDYDLLKLEMEELDNPELTGFDEDELNGILAEVGEGLTDPDEVPEVPVEPVTVSGDLWELGEHRVLCGDATKAEEVDRLMDGSKADMVFTDPPYGVNFQYNKYDDNVSKDEHAKFCKKWFSILRTCSDFIVITPGFDNEHIFFEIDKNFSSVVWFKKFSISASRVAFARTCEPIFILGKPPKKRYNTDFFEYGTDREKGLNNKHPCPKPIGLLTALIDPQTSLSDTVLDIFLGSGTTLIACQKTGRKCYGMEIDPQYCDVIISRWSEFTGKDDLLLNGKPFKWSEREISKAA